MRVGILDLDSKRERMGHGKTDRFPNLACGKIYGYHKLNGDEIIYPWRGERVDRLYVATIFSWTRPAIERQLPVWERATGEIIIGGTGWDYRSKLPPEIEAVSPRWTYDLYGIDYGIGFTVRGCHVGCSFCVVPRKEGTKEYRVATIGDLVNPRGNHVVLLNNNSFAEDGFFDDVAEIRERGLTVNWNQANDITLLTPAHAAALASVQYRNFNCTKPMLHFACDQMIKRKLDPMTGQVVEYDMLRVVPEKVRMLAETGIPPHHLTFYMLIGFDTTLEEDLARFYMLHDLGCHVYAMMYRDLRGRNGVDGRGRPQGAWVKPLRDWINGHGFRNVPFAEFDRYVRRQQQLRLAL
ncbi:hypothetical protein [Symbiobacterium terraclitae]|uniref:hypothetical protein n=1 Tax=Symbiobacterium terraclitae TaxID=557451 RepID=UPI0035B4FC62